MEPEDGPGGCRSQGLPAACSSRLPGATPAAQSFLLFPPLVYPSLESDEDSPVFKSRSKKRKGSDDAPYSPTGSAGGWEGGGLSTQNASSRVAHPLALWLRQGVCCLQEPDWGSTSIPGPQPGALANTQRHPGSCQ